MSSRGAARHPAPLDDVVRRRMRSTGRRDTKPELALRSELHRAGLRYRLDRAPLSGSRTRANILFVSTRVAVFVDGCFWHAFPVHATWPKHNGAWWREKIEKNRVRDRNTDRYLRGAGWSVVRVWEHEDPVAAAAKIIGKLHRRAAPARSPR